MISVRKKQVNLCTSQYILHRLKMERLVKCIWNTSFFQFAFSPFRQDWNLRQMTCCAWGACCGHDRQFLTIRSQQQWQKKLLWAKLDCYNARELGWYYWPQRSSSRPINSVSKGIIWLSKLYIYIDVVIWICDKHKKVLGLQIQWSNKLVSSISKCLTCVCIYGIYLYV